MNYETAKALKDAGFPQSAPNAFYWCTYVLSASSGSEKVTPYLIWGSQGWVDSVLVRAPTLEELIEACGTITDFSLQRLRDSWWAGSSDTDRISEETLPSGTGSTPTEAVANLYLSLHKVDKTV